MISGKRLAIICILFSALLLVSVVFGLILFKQTYELKNTVDFYENPEPAGTYIGGSQMTVSNGTTQFIVLAFDGTYMRYTGTPTTDALIHDTGEYSRGQNGMFIFTSDSGETYKYPGGNGGIYYYDSAEGNDPVFFEKIGDTPTYMYLNAPGTRPSETDTLDKAG